MKNRCYWCFVLIALCFTGLKTTQAIKFEIDKEECFSYNCPHAGELLRLSFVVTDSNAPWRYGKDGVHLAVTDPSGAKILEYRDKTSEKYEFMIRHKGVYKFCFSNKSPYYETIDFNVDTGSYIHHGYEGYEDDHAKEEHVSSLHEPISKMRETLDEILFEQFWLMAQMDRQIKMDEYTSKRAVMKAAVESVALVAVSVLQVFLLKSLFDRKFGLQNKLSKLLSLLGF